MQFFEEPMPDPSRWLNEHILGWRNLPAREKKAIRDFAVLWTFFELHSTGMHGRPNANPDNIIQAVHDLVNEPDRQRLEVARAYFRERYFFGAGHRARWSHLRVSHCYAQRVTEGLQGHEATSSQILLALLLLINRLRNNFLHGEKAAYDFCRAV
jgi:hypothetical protein